MLRNILHLDRVAQVRLVGAVFAHRVIVGDARELLRHRLAVGEGLEHAAQTGSMVENTSSCSTKLISRSSW